MKLTETSATVPTVDDLYRRGLYRDLGLCGQAITKLSEQMRDGDESVRDNAVQALATQLGELLDIAQCIEEPRRPHWCDPDGHVNPGRAIGAWGEIVAETGRRAVGLSASFDVPAQAYVAVHRMLDELDRASRFCRAYLRELRRREEVSNGR